MRTIGWALLVTALLGPPAASAQSSTLPPAADLLDLYAWKGPSGDTLEVALTFHRLAAADEPFSPDVLYVLHLESRPTFADGPGVETRVLCEFPSPAAARCWAGDEVFVEGDPTAPAGMESADGRLRVFAGVRDDPFFFNLQGFARMAGTVRVARDALAYDPAGCPAVDTATANVLVTMLGSDGEGGPPADSFFDTNVQALVVELDLALVTTGGPVVGVWASTHARP